MTRLSVVFAGRTDGNIPACTVKRCTLLAPTVPVDFLRQYPQPNRAMPSRANHWKPTFERSYSSRWSDGSRVTPVSCRLMDP